MRKIFIKIFFVFFIFSSLLFFSGCGTTEIFNCPYVIDSPHVELGKKKGSHNFAGAYFSVFNGSDKTVSEITVSFLLFDENGENPFIGSNNVVATLEKRIQPSETESFIINLDTYISIVPEEPYRLGFIYLRKIKYEDGTVWSDPLGMFSVKEA